MVPYPPISRVSVLSHVARVALNHRRPNASNGYGSKLYHQGTAGFTPCFHLLGLLFGYLFLTHTQMAEKRRHLLHSQLPRPASNSLRERWCSNSFRWLVVSTKTKEKKKGKTKWRLDPCKTWEKTWGVGQN